MNFFSIVFAIFCFEATEAGMHFTTRGGIHDYLEYDQGTQAVQSGFLGPVSKKLPQGACSAGYGKLSEML